MIATEQTAWEYEGSGWLTAAVGATAIPFTPYSRLLIIAGTLWALMWLTYRMGSESNDEC